MYQLNHGHIETRARVPPCSSGSRVNRMDWGRLFLRERGRDGQRNQHCLARQVSRNGSDDFKRQDLPDSNGNLVFASDRDWRIRAVNWAAEILTSYTRDELLESTLWDSDAGGVANAHQTGVAGFAKTGRSGLRS